MLLNRNIVRQCGTPKFSRAETRCRPVPCASTGSGGEPVVGKRSLNIIPNNGREQGRAVDGIPPVMGAHLMASGAISPLSTSKGAGVGTAPLEFEYPMQEGDAEVVILPPKEPYSQALVEQVVKAATSAIAEKGTFTLVLAGGSLPKQLSGLLDGKYSGMAWDKWHIMFVDERNVPHSSPDSTFKAVKEAFLDKLPIPAGNIHSILENVTAHEAAVNMEGRLIGLPRGVLPRSESGLPVFDLILLGMGPDGHIASLFPNHPATAAQKGWVLPITNSPKPPPERITMTLPVINAAKEIIVVAAGAEKSEVVQRVLEVQALPGALPAQMVRPTGKLRWYLDEGSAQALSIDKWGDSKAFPRSS